MEKDIIITEIIYKAIRSSGAGGQHVNKVSSKVSISFDLANSNGLSIDEKDLLMKNLASKLTKEGVLLMAADESRSQFRNKALVTERLFQTLTLNLIVPTVRKATKPSFGSVQRKLKAKAVQSEKKKLRKPANPE